MDKVRYGIIGVGAIALRSHIPAIEMMGDAEVVALYNPSRANAEKGAQLCRLQPAIVEDYREILSRSDVDAVLVASPNHMHKEQTLAALSAGKHVLCEKPMANSEEDCLAIYEAARSARTIYQIGLEMRYSDFFEKMSQIVEGGQIGRPRMLFCKEFRWALMPGARGWRHDAMRSGGTLLEMNSHHFDLLNWFSGSKPRRVMAMGGNDVNSDGQIDNAWVTVEYANGARACLGMCKFSNHGNDIIEFTVVGDKGRIDSSAGNQAIYQWGNDKPDKTVYNVAMDASFGSIEAEPSFKERWVLWERSMVYREHRSFVDCIKGGKQPFAGAAVALESALVPLAAQRALRTGEIVELG